MSLWDEAEKMSLGAVQFYRFGFFVALGMAAAAAVIGFLSWAKRCERGTTPLLLFLSLLLGGICSRLGFCLMNQELGEMMPVKSWLNITGGGWCMMTLIGGVMLAAWVTAKITRQKAGQVLDIVACALPAFMVLERIGEGFIREDGIPSFNYSRPLETRFLTNTFLSFSDQYEDEFYLATWRLAAIVMGILFVILMLDLIRSEKHGDTCLMFLMFFGAASVILESLRYDRFLSITFVGLEQVLAAILLLMGVTISAVRNRTHRKKMAMIAMISVFAAAGIAVGLEFALDRTTVSKILIYAVFILVIFTPAALGLHLRKTFRRQ